MAGIIFLLFFIYVFTYVPFLTDRRAKICAKTASVLCSTALVLGSIGSSGESILDTLSRYQNSLIKNEAAVTISCSGYRSISDLIVLAVTFAGVCVICYYILLKVLEAAQYLQLYEESDRADAYGWRGHIQIFVLMLLCWMPYFILNYPGVLSYDSIYQIAQAEGAIPVNDHHPAVHTACIAFFYHIGKRIFGTANAGAAFFVFMQMIVMAFIESKLVVILRRSSLKPVYAWGVWIYFALVPLHAMYAVTMWKDILFAGCILWFSMVLYEICVQKRKGSMIWVQYMASGILLTLFRSNGMIVFLICLPFLIYFFRKSRKFVCFIILPVFVFGFVKGPVYHMCHVQPANMVESLSMPIQQIARVVVNCEEELTVREKEMIEHAASLEDIKKTYNCRISDPLKNLISIDAVKEHKLEYLQLWVTLGIKHPVEYALAQINATAGYWYPDMQYFVIFDGVEKNDFGIYSPLELKEKVRSILQRWYNLYRKVPVFGNFFSMGTVFLLIVLCIMKNIYDRQYARVLVAVPSLANWMTIMMAAPVFAEMRYVYGIMLTVPLIIFTAFLPRREMAEGRVEEKRNG